VQTDRVEVKNRASDEHNRRDDDHTGTPVRERELESYYNIPGNPVRERELEYQSDTSVLLIHNSTGIYYCI